MLNRCQIHFIFLLNQMPNLGQGGCQALEDAYVIAQNIEAITKRDEIPRALNNYQHRRLVRSAAVQGLSRFASDIIIRGFDTPAKIAFNDGMVHFENFNYAGISRVCYNQSYQSSSRYNSTFCTKDGEMKWELI